MGTNFEILDLERRLPEIFKKTKKKKGKKKKEISGNRIKSLSPLLKIQIRQQNPQFSVPFSQFPPTFSGKIFPIFLLIILLFCSSF